MFGVLGKKFKILVDFGWMIMSQLNLYVDSSHTVIRWQDSMIDINQ
jgi:hypothetical protein